MINRNLINTTLAPCPKRYKSMYKYGVGIQVIQGDSPILDVAIYNRDREPVIRIFIDKETWLIYNYMTAKWDKRTFEYILGEKSWYSIKAEIFFVRKKEISLICSFFKQINVELKGTGFDAIDSYMGILRSIRNFENRKEKEARKEALLQKTIDNAPELPEDVDEYIRSFVMHKSRYLFFETKGKTKLGYCTYCSNTSVIPYHSRHKATGVCPECGSSVILMSQRYSHKYLYNEKTFTIMQFDGETIYVRTFFVCWDFQDHLNVKKKLHLASISYFNASEKVYFNFVSGRFKRMCGAMFVSNGVWYYNTDMYHNYDTVYPLSRHKIFSGKIYRFFKKARDGKELKIRLCFLDYLDKIPYIEMLINNGFKKLAKDIVTKKHDIKLALNMKGKSIAEVFELPRYEINVIKKRDLDLTELILYKRLRTEAGLKCNDDIFLYMELFGGLCEDRFFELMKYTTPQKLLNYFSKQFKKKIESSNWDLYGFMSTWSDYISICIYLGYDIQKSIILYPRQLKKKHDEIAAIQRQLIEAERARKKEEAEAEQQRKDRENALFVEKIAKNINKQLAYNNSNYLIRAAENVQELLDEGIALDHCVGGYADRIAQGTTAVLFIRKINEPDKPLCTVEYMRNINYVGQCSGHKNKLENQSVIEFIDEWKEVKKIA